MAAATAPAAAPGPDTEPRITLTPLRVFEYFALIYRRTWRSSLMTSFLQPVLYLLAMGLGLGTLVNQGQSTGATATLPHGVSYLAFLAPALLAATAMQTASTECTYPVMAAIKWLRTYFGMLATPVAVAGIVGGQLAWVAVRLTMVGTVFLAVMAAFGTVHHATAVLAIPAGVLCGLAFAAPIAAFSATRENDRAFSALFRFGIVPLFLFAGVFFPVTQLPGPLQPVAYATPLWHGVDLCRRLTLGTATLASSAVHVAYLLAWFLVGAAAAVVTHRRRLTL